LSFGWSGHLARGMHRPSPGDRQLRFTYCLGFGRNRTASSRGRRRASVRTARQAQRGKWSSRTMVALAARSPTSYYTRMRNRIVVCTGASTRGGRRGKHVNRLEMDGDCRTNTSGGNRRSTYHGVREDSRDGGKAGYAAVLIGGLGAQQTSSDRRPFAITCIPFGNRAV